ncbi:hypothetical protein LEP1GSC041_3645 [Leptospira noguchii str. 2006001870]|uniref:Uncharacterized protein n=1 Tax=Leptospira noguchii serovar Autumnalis str. ZUN142 TaxID=1085540 RepID=M6U8E7_9LEPT|nr:hypothetical protein LEP1GSC041_3645 [Leptospira noguchii str. 2006001870]EMO39236.1 hypothetical protein LEP1GSC186_0018 [Leptospira noguchii serovar Autumnalis str. ZUN142]
MLNSEENELRSRSSTLQISKVFRNEMYDWIVTPEKIRRFFLKCRNPFIEDYQF